MTPSERTEECALVTGGTDGIGKEIARGLAWRGVRVLIVGRDLAKGERAQAELRASSGNLDVDFIPTDLSLMGEVRRLADEVRRRFAQLHYLVHSAGLVRGRQILTGEGIESNFAINYLSRFALTTRLLPLLESSGGPGHASRILLIGGAATQGTIFFNDVNLTANFGVIRMLGQVCRANDVFTVELARRLSSNGQPRVTVTNLKIGVVPTNTRRRPDFPRFMKVLAPLLDPFVSISLREATLPGLRLLFDEEFEGVTGALFLMIRKFRRIEPSTDVTDPRIGQRLWELSEFKISGARLFAQASVARERTPQLA
jgi:NAD(P)-dependent dehydrogenase (short-subunit alcohol dehydrogenase family)